MNLNERLTYLGEILVALSRSPIPSHQFQTLADFAGTALPCDFLAVCLLDPDKDGYRVHVLIGALPDALPRQVLPPGEGIAGQVIQTRRSSLCDDLRQHPHASEAFEAILGRLGLRSALVVPLRQGEEVLGALYLAAQPPTIYGFDDMQIAGLLAAGLSASLETARLYQRLADERSVLGAVLGSTSDGVVVVNPQGVVLMANPALGQMLQLDAEELVGRHFRDADSPSLARLFAGMGREQQMELALPQGRTALADLAPVHTPAGEEIGYAGILHDITSLKELENMKNEFIQTVSHDLKNPIASVLLAADLLGRAGPLTEEQQRVQGRIVETSEYMSQLVSNLLDLGRIEAGLGLDLAPMDLAQLARSVLADVYPQAQSKEIELLLDSPESVPLRGDRERLRQVLLNLAGNAIKYTPAGSVTVTIRPVPPHVQVSVQDTGLGIPPLDLPHVFEKFYRASTAAGSIKGTGLGLSIVKSVVEAHGGQVWAESSEGKGSTFTFRLPLGLDPQAN